MKINKVYIAGQRGMVGAAIWKAREEKGLLNLLEKQAKSLIYVINQM